MSQYEVFVSYRHAEKDQEFRDKLMRFLKYLEQQGSLKVWYDERIEPSDAWDPEIRQALDRCRVGVLLLSQDFLKSDYITKVELPVLAQRWRDGGLHLTHLSLSPSLADLHKIALPDGTEIGLLDPQGLNSPGRPLSLLASSHHDLEAALTDAARKILELCRKPLPAELTSAAPQPGTPSDCFELTVALQTSGSDRLIRSYHLPGQPDIVPAGEVADWPELQRSLRRWIQGGAKADTADQLKGILFRLLFGRPEDGAYHPVLARAFGRSPTDRPEPILYSLRLRVETDDPLLLRAPWHCAAWHCAARHCAARQDSSLVDNGWSLGLAPPGLDRDRYPAVVLSGAPRILVVLGEEDDGPLRTGSHRKDLAHLGYTADESIRRLPITAWSLGGLDEALGEQPDLVYYYGKLKDGGLALAGEGEPLSPQDFARKLAGTKAVLLNLVGEVPDPAGLWRALSGAAPFVALQHGTDEQPLCAAGRTWLRRVLAGEDPAQALHQCGLPTALTGLGYRAWRRDQAPSVAEALIDLLLDRHNQKQRVSEAVRRLVTTRDHRVLAVLGYGEPGNRVERFSEQIFDYVRQDRPETALRTVDLVRLDAACRTREALRDAMDAFLGQYAIDYCLTETLWKLPDEPMHDEPGRTPVLFVRWECAKEGEASLLKLVEAWLDFCVTDLAGSCGEQRRLLCYLPLEVEPITDSFKGGLRQVQTKDMLIEGPLRFLKLEPLGEVEEDDLRDFLLQDLDCGGLKPRERSELSDLLWTETQGNFDSLVRRLEELRDQGWVQGLEQLRKKATGQ